MNFSNILEEIESVDEEIYERTDERRKVIKNLLGSASRIALSAIPVALGGLLNKAYGKVPGEIIDVLNFRTYS